MNIYWVNAACEIESGSSLRQIYGCVYETRPALDDIDHFSGKPYPKTPAKVTLLIDKPKLPRPDFLSAGYKKLVCGQKALSVLGPLLKKSGELIPATIAKDKTPYAVVNITRLLRGVVHKSKSTYVGPRLKKPAFHAAKIGAEVTLFKVPENFGGRIYCVERTGRAEDGEFKALVEQHGLKGLEFKLVWSDRKGVAPTPTELGAKKPSKAESGTKSKTKPSNERSLTTGEWKDIRLSIQRGYETLGLDPSTSADRVQKAIRREVDRIIKAKTRPDREELKDFAVNVGCLWGQTVCDAGKWEWRAVKTKGVFIPAVVSPDHAHCTLPMHFIQSQLSRRPSEGSSTMLLYEMIKAGSQLSRAKPGELVTIG